MDANVAGILMAGGEGSRMEDTKEKPLISIKGKPMFEHVMDALKKLDDIDRTIVAVTPKTPKTAEYAKNLPVEIVKTQGEGYCVDMKAAIDEVNCDIGLIVPSDLPFLTSDILEGVLNRFNKAGKPALSVFVPLDLVERLGLPTDMEYKVDGEEVVPVGINIIENNKEGNSHLKQEDFVLPKKELALNVNDRRSLRIAEKIFPQEGFYSK